MVSRSQSDFSTSFVANLSAAMAAGVPLTSVAQPDSPRYLAAKQVYESTGSMALVLDGLTETIVAEKQIRRALRWPFIYLLIVLLIAICGLIFFVFRIDPLYVSLREDLMLPAAIKPVERFNLSAWLPTILLFLSITFFVLILGLLLGGFRKLVMWIGGRRFVDSRVSATAMQTLAQLHDVGIDSATALELSQNLIAGGSRVNEVLETASKRMSSAVAKDSVLATASSNNSQSQQWKLLAEYRLTAADQQLSYLQVATPVVLLTTVGAAIGLGYGLAIYGPLLLLIRDLMTAGT